MLQHPLTFIFDDFRYVLWEFPYAFSPWDILCGGLVEDVNAYNGNLSKQNNSLEKISATVERYNMITLPILTQKFPLCQELRR